MLFHIFRSQDERRAYGGSAFLELQFCCLPPGTPIAKIVDSIECWKNDSLYVDDENSFYNIYSHIFSGGTYANLQTGIVDLYGINYYSPSLTQHILEQVILEKPTDCKILCEWLKKAGSYNGFYILGL